MSSVERYIAKFPAKGVVVGDLVKAEEGKEYVALHLLKDDWFKAGEESFPTYGEAKQKIADNLEATVTSLEKKIAKVKGLQARYRQIDPESLVLPTSSEPEEENEEEEDEVEDENEEENDEEEEDEV